MEAFEILENLPVPVAIVTPRGSFVFENAPWRRFLGVRHGETTTRRVASAIHPDDLHEADAAWKLAVASGTPSRAAVRVRRANDGAFVMLHVACQPVPDASGVVTRWCVIAAPAEGSRAVPLAPPERAPSWPAGGSFMLRSPALRASRPDA